jgi:hypothetical protein
MGTGENVKVFATDHFKDDIKQMTCDSKLSLTFRDEEKYEDAVDDWKWVNENTIRNFGMLVSGCPEPDSDLQKWLVSNATFNRAHLTVDFTAQKTTWHDMPLNYTLQWGIMPDAVSGAPLPQTNFNEQPAQKVARSFFEVAGLLPRFLGINIPNPVSIVKSEVIDPATSVIKSEVIAPVTSVIPSIVPVITSAVAPIVTPVVDTLNGKPMDESFNIPMKVPFPEQLIKKETTGGFEFGASCKDCGLKGDLKVAGHIMVDMSKEDPIQEFWLDVSPGGLEMTAAFAIDVGGTFDPKKPWGKNMSLPEITIPGFGIKGLASINPSIAPKVGVLASSIQGTGSISAGASAKFKDDAKARLALKKDTPGSDSPTNWDPEVSEKELTVDSLISGSVGLFMEVDLVIQATLLKPPINIPGK